MSRSCLLLALVMLCGTATNVRADFLPNLIPDQYILYVGGSYNIQSAQPIGESFTPFTNSIQFAAFAFHGGTIDFSIQVQLYQGVGVSGPLLATSQTLTLPANFGLNDRLGELAYFYFDSPVALNAGSPYTLILNQLSGREVFVDYIAAGQKGSVGILDGKAYPGYPGSPDFNLTFGEGSIAPAVVPEPPSFALWGLAASCGLLIVRSRLAS